MPRPKRQLRRPMRLAEAETPAKRRHRRTVNVPNVANEGCSSGVNVNRPTVNDASMVNNATPNVSGPRASATESMPSVSSVGEQALDGGVQVPLASPRQNGESGFNSGVTFPSGPEINQIATSSRPMVAFSVGSNQSVGCFPGVASVISPQTGSNSIYSTSNVRPYVGMGTHPVTTLNPTWSMGNYPSSVGVNGTSSVPIFASNNACLVTGTSTMGMGPSLSSNSPTVIPMFGGTAFSQPEVLPQVNSQLGFHVPQNIKEKIWAGLYIDLSILLHDHARAILSREEKGSELTFVMEGGKMVIKQGGSRGKKIDSFDKWCSAFHTYMAIYLAKQPARAIEMLKYIETIRLAASQFPGVGWRHYDEQFRLQLESNPSSSWGEVNMELWVTVAAAASVQPSSVAQFQSSQATRGTCFAFNSTKGCHLRFCKFSHKCGKCLRFGHSSTMCQGGKGAVMNRSRFVPAQKQNPPPRSDTAAFRGQKQAQPTKTYAKAQHSFRASNTN